MAKKREISECGLIRTPVNKRAPMTSIERPFSDAADEALLGGQGRGRGGEDTVSVDKAAFAAMGISSPIMTPQGKGCLRNHGGCRHGRGRQAKMGDRANAGSLQRNRGELFQLMTIVGSCTPMALPQQHSYEGDNKLALRRALLNVRRG